MRGKLDVRSDYTAQPIDEAITRTDEFAIFFDRCDRVIGGTLAAGRPYEPHISRVLRAFLRDGQTFVDVGANIGYFSLLAARLVGELGHVIAFEPVSFNYGLFEKSIAQNGFVNIELHRKAVLACDGSVEMLQFERRNSGSFHLRRAIDGEDPAGERLIAEAVRLDDALGRRPVHLVKIDVEGAEGLALQGMQATLREHRPLVVIEYAPQAIAEVSRVSGEELLQAMRDLGYAVMDTRSFDGQLVPESQAQIGRALRRVGQHIDLLFFPS
jgi:FkbM family methyltransferase